MSKNASSSLPMDLSRPTYHIVLNIITLIGTTMGTSVSSIILAGVLLRRKTLLNVRLILCANSYIVVFFLGIFELMHTVKVAQGDFGILITEEETMECRIQAYIVFSLITAVYLGCVLQAVFCLFRIVYPSVVWMTEPRTYLIIFPIKWIASFVLMAPLLIWHGHRLIPGEHTCRITDDDPFSIAYATLVVHGIPFSSLAFIYFRVHRFLRQKVRAMTVATPLTPRSRRRDIVVFRRIMIIVILLGAYGVPNAIMLIMLAIEHKLVASFYRILELSFAAAILTLSVALLYINPHLSHEIKMFPKP